MPLNQKNPDNNIPEVKKLKKTNEPSEKESDAVRIIRLYAYVTHREGRNISRQYCNDYTYINPSPSPQAILSFTWFPS